MKYVIDKMFLYSQVYFVLVISGILCLLPGIQNIQEI